MVRIKHALLFFFCTLQILARAQDIELTQFYAAPLYLNPAFTGANVCSRLATTYRNQWPGIKKTYVSYMGSYDHSLPSISSGIGVLFSNDKAGSGQLRTTSFSALYSYEAQITRKWTGRVGIQAGETLRGLSFNNLIFGDQISRNNAAASVETGTSRNRLYFDVSSGLLVYSQKYWFGFAAHHLTQPNQSLAGGESRLPIKYAIHSGMNLPVGAPVKSKKSSTPLSLQQSIAPAINFRMQGKFKQLDLGFYYNYHPMVLGLWYRGIPVIKTYEGTSQVNHDAIALIAGFEIEDFKFGYSYDLHISRLGANSGGAHEVSLSYQFCDYNSLKNKSKKPKQRTIVPCAKF